MDGRPPDVEEWLHKWSPTQQEQAQNLAAVVHAADEAVAEAIKWRRLTFTVDDNWHHWLCAVAVTKGGVSLVFHKGSSLLKNSPADGTAEPLKSWGMPMVALKRVTAADAVGIAEVPSPTSVPAPSSSAGAGSWLNRSARCCFVRQ